jgi:hypothetical protein
MRRSGLRAVRPERGEWTDDRAAALERDMTSTLLARPVETRRRPLYATGFIHGFALWYSIEKLFMRLIGLNDYLITIATIVYIVMMIANIPLGILADRYQSQPRGDREARTKASSREESRLLQGGERLRAHGGQRVRAADDSSRRPVCRVAAGRDPDPVLAIGAGRGVRLLHGLRPAARRASVLGGVVRRVPRVRDRPGIPRPQAERGAGRRPPLGDGVRLVLPAGRPASGTPPVGKTGSLPPGPCHAGAGTAIRRRAGHRQSRKALMKLTRLAAVLPALALAGPALPAAAPGPRRPVSDRDDHHRPRRPPGRAVVREYLLLRQGPQELLPHRRQQPPHCQSGVLLCDHHDGQVAGPAGQARSRAAPYAIASRLQRIGA